MSAPGALRALVLLLLAAALALPSTWSDARTSSRALWMEGRGMEGVADALLAPDAPPVIARSASDAPTEAELELLGAAASRAPLFAALPKEAALVEANAPARALAGRAAAIPFRLRAKAGDSVTVVLSDATGALDSVRVRADGAGLASGAFRVRPPRAGWREWTVVAGGRRAVTGAWVDSAGPPRVLVRASFPGWESKFVVRALEESGGRVETVFPLGRGLSVAAGGGAATPARLAAVDAVVVLDGAAIDEGERRLLADWAAEGGGVLLAGDQAGAGGFALTRGGEQALALNGQAIRWTLPAELAALPTDRVRAAAMPFAGPAAGAWIGASAPEGGVLALRPLGRGRAAALALGETWRWRMESGHIAEHREFWRALVDWLASAPRDPVTVRVPRPIAPAGVRREVRVFDARGDSAGAAPALVVARPGGAADTVALARDPSSPGVLLGTVVPATDGVYTLAVVGRPPSAAFRAGGSPSPEADAWARLSLLAAGSGGGAIPADSLRAVVERRTAGLPGGPRGPSRTLLFALLLAAAGAEWAIRRLKGRA